MAQLTIAVQYEQSPTDDPYLLQIIVESDKEPEEMVKEIKSLWDEFQNAQPDTDDEFCSFLEERGYRAMTVEPVALILKG